MVTVVYRFHLKTSRIEQILLLNVGNWKVRIGDDLEFHKIHPILVQIAHWFKS